MNIQSVRSFFANHKRLTLVLIAGFLATAFFLGAHSAPADPVANQSPEQSEQTLAVFDVQELEAEQEDASADDTQESESSETAVAITTQTSNNVVVDQSGTQDSAQPVEPDPQPEEQEEDEAPVEQPPFKGHCSTKGSQSTTEYLQNATYSPTNEFYRALVFAGLDELVDSPQYIVFAPNDYVFNTKLSQEQWDYLYSSPSVMESYLKWHIVPSCVTWAAEVAGLPKGESMIIETLGGSATYEFGGPGKLNGQTVGIWDFFTSNGAVHYIGGFVKEVIVPSS